MTKCSLNNYYCTKVLDYDTKVVSQHIYFKHNFGQGPSSSVYKLKIELLFMLILWLSACVHVPGTKTKGVNDCVNRSVD